MLDELAFVVTLLTAVVIDRRFVGKNHLLDIERRFVWLIKWFLRLTRIERAVQDDLLEEGRLILHSFSVLD
jgi:hypothetical protein